MLVPWLILLASVLFLIQPVLSRGLRIHERPDGPPPWLVGSVTFFQLGVAIYGGYFGAGIGILMLSSLGLMGVGDLVHMNALKTVLAAAINFVSLVIFIVEGKVVWPYALVMMAAAVAGGYWGANLGRVLNKTVLRWFVIVVGLSLAAYYFLRQWIG
jgi:uncharacterized membrane protein YfcA